MNNDERFEQIDDIVIQFWELSDEEMMKAKAMTTNGMIIVKLITICKNQEFRIKELERKNGWE